uniref:Uncharacterized protein n=1 Tax=Anguilla anguilla TaxID=7936 RepID=A0A0E9SNF0_ANGAN
MDSKSICCTEYALPLAVDSEFNYLFIWETTRIIRQLFEG